jgi:hypothetical protein
MLQRYLADLFDENCSLRRWKVILTKLHHDATGGCTMLQFISDVKG